jgi:hypothetical protein
VRATQHVSALRTQYKGREDSRIRCAFTHGVLPPILLHLRLDALRHRVERREFTRPPPAAEVLLRLGEVLHR